MLQVFRPNVAATAVKGADRFNLFLFQVSGKGKPGGAAVYHPESYEGQQPEGLHA